MGAGREGGQSEARLIREAGVELRLAPLRAPGAALGQAALGAACLVPGGLGALAVAPGADADAAGGIAFWLASIFIVPLLGFGAFFFGRAGFGLVNSLTLRADASGIVTTRALFGLPLAARRIARADIIGLEAVAERALPGAGGAEPYYRLLARTGGRPRGGPRLVTLADGVRGAAAARRLQAQIAAAARLEHLLREEGERAAS